MWKIVIFVLGSLLLVFVSRSSLRDGKSHGFYRFFAWECILALFLLNADYWLYKPLAWNQIIAWTLLVICLIPLALGIQSLRTRGKPAERREGDPSLLAFEKTTRLVTSGIYRYIRHPLYSSLLFLAWGIFFKLPSIAPGVVAVTTTVFLIATARADENECRLFFGDEYQRYIQRTRMFIPYIF